MLDNICAPQAVKEFNLSVTKLLKETKPEDLVEILSGRFELVPSRAAVVNNNNNNNNRSLA
jgi:hypothetical protein